jgi:hypothetical protein
MRLLTGFSFGGLRGCVVRLIVEGGVYDIAFDDAGNKTVTQVTESHSSPCGSLGTLGTLGRR